MGFKPALFTLFVLFFCLNKTHAQDTIVFEGKHLYIVDITEEREQNVIFKKLNLKKSPTYVLDKRYISDIWYHDPATASQKFNPEPLVEQRSLELWIVPIGADEVYRGEMESLTDSAIVFKKRKKSEMEVESTLPTSVDIFPYQTIKTISVRKRDRMRKLALWGTASGFTVGTVVGLLLFEDTPPCDPNNIDGMPCDPSLSSPRSRWEKALLLGAGGGGVGMLTGGLVGSFKVRIPIQGRKDAYQVAIPKLERLARKKR